MGLEQITNYFDLSLEKATKKTIDTVSKVHKGTVINLNGH